MSVTNMHEVNARLAKAELLADIMAEHGISADTAEQMPAGVWQLAIELASERRGRTVMPASVATQALVVSLLRQRERGPIANPLDGIGTRG